MIMKSYLAVFLLVAAFYSAKGQGNPTPSSSSFVLKPNSSNGTVSVLQNVTTIHISPSKTASPVSSNIKPSYKPQSQSVQPNKTQTTHPNNTQTIHPNNTQTVHPNNTQTIHPNNTQTVHPNNTQTIHPNNTHTAHVPSNGTVPVVTPSASHSMVGPTKPPTKSAGKDDKDYDSVKKRLWIAGSFAIIFALTTVILAYLVYRQRKINRELSGDPASSRLL